MKRVNVNAFFFVLLGAMNGAILALVAAFFLDYMLTKYSLICTLTYMDWVIVLVPVFVVIGSLFNLASAIFLYDEETTKPKKRFKAKTKTTKKKK